jgi:hypothetical protein
MHRSLLNNIHDGIKENVTTHMVRLSRRYHANMKHACRLQSRAYNQFITGDTMHAIRSSAAGDMTCQFRSDRISAWP